MGDPGFSNDWWGRDPIELAEPETREERLNRLKRQEMKNRLLINNNEMLINIMRGWVQ